MAGAAASPPTQDQPGRTPARPGWSAFALAMAGAWIARTRSNWSDRLAAFMPFLGVTLLLRSTRAGRPRGPLRMVVEHHAPRCIGTVLRASGDGPEPHRMIPGEAA